MKRKEELKKEGSTRRDFIKKKVFGGMLFASGLPFLPLQGLFKGERRLEEDTPEKLEAFEEVKWDKLRKFFPLDKTLYHFNTASLGPSPKMVVKEIQKSLDILAFQGFDGHSEINRTHDKIANFLNVTPEEIAITRNATEGMNIAARSLPLKAGDEIIISSHEHIGGAAPWLALQKDMGVKVKVVDLDLSGENNLQILKDSISENTKVVSISHVTCTTGLILPVKEIVALCRERNIVSVIDGAQAIGMIPLDLKDINADFYSCSGHKWLFGPKGTGILFINKSILNQSVPVFVGSYSDKKYDLSTASMEYRESAQRQEYGTRSIPLVKGLASSIDFINSLGIENIAERGQWLANYFCDRIKQNKKIEVLSSQNPKYSSSIVTIRVVDLNNANLVKQLYKRKKHLRLRSMYENDIKGIRISFSILNSIQEVDYLINSIEETI